MISYALTEEEKTERGEMLARLFKLKKSPDYPDRYLTDWGTKSAIGVYRAAKRIIEEGD